MSVPAHEVSVRPFEKEDLEAVSRIEQACFDDPYPEYFFLQLAEANPETFLVAFTESILAGYAVIDRWADHYHLVSIAVQPEHRRKGVAQLLLNQLESLLPRERAIRLEVRKNNKPAIQFYTKNGYKLVGLEEHYYRDGEDALVMEKNIDARQNDGNATAKKGKSLLVN